MRRALGRLEKMRQPDPAQDEAVFYREHRAVVFDFVLRRLGSVPDAESVVQECFARVLRARRESVIEHPRAYLLRTAANLANDLHRQRQRRPPDPATPLPPEDRTDHGRVRAAVARLPEALRTVIVLRYAEELSFAAIAERLGLSKNAAHHRHKRALEALRGELR